MAANDLVIIGGGIVGLATADRYLARYPDRRLTLLEKEPELAQHQSGHNSGVLHSGIYYEPGSLKARLCRDGKRALEEFCAAEGVAFEICGKVIVATDHAELPRLERILHRGQANSVPCELIEAAQLHELEPHAAGLKAIHVPGTGIVDFPGVCRKLAERIVRAGGTVVTSARVTGLRETQGEVVVSSAAGEYAARQAINCAGLHSDRVARMGGATLGAQIVPFRGEFFVLADEAKHLVKNLIYPVPDPAFPFLGVHFTRMVDGTTECGPNAVLAGAREGYRKRDVNLRDLCGSLTYGGFLRLAARYWRTGAGEMWRSVSKGAFVAELRRLVPEIRTEHLRPAPAGVRAQAVSPDGRLVDDFLFHETGRTLHVLNAPSPAATASLEIAATLVDRLAARSK